MDHQNPPPPGQAPWANQPGPGYPSSGYPPGPGYPPSGYPPHGGPPPGGPVQPGYPGASGYPAQFAAPPPKPPLDARQKSGARLAGILGFLLLNLGATLFLVPIVVMLFGALVGFIFKTISTGMAGTDENFPAWESFFYELNLSVIVPILVAVVLLGLVIMVAALFLSVRILRTHGLAKAWPITWAGAGIGLVANTIVVNGISLPFTFFPLDIDGSNVTAASNIVIGIVGLLIVGIATAVVGWLSWWLMAHAMRPAATSGSAPAQGPATHYPG